MPIMAKFYNTNVSPLSGSLVSSERCFDVLLQHKFYQKHTRSTSAPPGQIQLGIGT